MRWPREKLLACWCQQGRRSRGGLQPPPPLFYANKEIYVILRDNCFSMKFQFLFSMWPTILRSISSHFSGTKFENFFQETRMHVWLPLILRFSPPTSYAVPASLKNNFEAVVQPEAIITCVCTLITDIQRLETIKLLSK